MTSSRATAYLILSVIAVGAALRVALVGSQLVVGDEIHPINVVVQDSLGQILSRFRAPDNCIPITAWCKVLYATVGLEEWGFRFLSYLPGIALLLIGVRAAAPFLRSTERVLLAVVLAGSPLLVFWSRTARPYSAVTLLGVLAVLSLAHFGREGRKRWGLVAGLSQFGLFWFSPTTVPAIAGMVAAGALWGFLNPGPSRSAKARLRRSALLLAPTLLAVVLVSTLLAPALPSLTHALDSAESRTKELQLDRWTHSIQLVYGLSRSPSGASPILAVGFVAMTAFGVLRFCRRNRGLAAPTLVLLLFSPLSYLLSDIKAMTMAPVIVRYNAAIIPFLLFFLVYGFGGFLETLTRRLPRTGPFVHATAIVLVVAFAAAGPLRSGWLPPFGLFYSRLFLTQGLMTDELRARAPAFYLEQARDDDLPVIDCLPRRRPGVSLMARYQLLHRNRLIRCHLDNSHGRLDALKFRTFRFGLPSLSEKPPDDAWVVLHRSRYTERSYLDSGELPPDVEPSDQVGRELRIALRLCRDAFGDPVYEDRWIVVFRKSAGASGRIPGS